MTISCCCASRIGPEVNKVESYFAIFPRVSRHFTVEHPLQGLAARHDDAPVRVDRLCWILQVLRTDYSENVEGIPSRVLAISRELLR